MKVYQLTEKDFERLCVIIDRNPVHGLNGGGSVVLTDTETEAHRTAHRFYNYHIRNWIADVCG